jgi:uncharacterized protein (DUF2252 family)
VRSRDLRAALQAQNAGGDPGLLALKYAEMRRTSFAFFRGTCGLYYSRAAAKGLLPRAPLGWLCGDLHLENFGSYRGENGLAYFDINDFDEAVLAPGTWDVLRLVASVLVWTRERRHSAAEQRAAARITLDAFGDALRRGRARWMERATAEGPVRKLLRQVKRRTQRQVLDERTVRSERGGRRLLREVGRQLPVSRADRRRVVGALARLARRWRDERSYRVLDVARRVAGLGSLGLPRWVILVEGDGSPHGNRLLDLKTARAPAAAPRARARQPRWRREAERVVRVQEWLEAEPPALLAAVDLGRTGCVLRELQPQADRLRLAHLDANPDRVGPVLRAMGHLAAWALLRGAGRHGAAGVEEWMSWAARPRWGRDLLERAGQLASACVADWREYCVAHDEGAFRHPQSG